MKNFRHLTIIAAALMMAACGGGSKTTSATPPPSSTSPTYPVQTTPAIVDTSTAIIHYDFESLVSNPSVSELCRYMSKINQCSSPLPVSVVDRSANNRALRIDVSLAAMMASTDPQMVIRADAKLDADYDELYVSYWIYFPAGFDLGKGGKLPGMLAGAPAGKWFPAGGTIPGVNGGFSARSMFYTSSKFDKDPKTVYAYVYHQNQADKFGDETRYVTPSGQKFDFYRLSPHDPILLEQRAGYFFETRVKMNTPGQRNGELETRINGVLVNKQSNYVFSDSGSHGINFAGFTMHYGGADTTWNPTATSYVLLDDLIVSTKPVTNSFK